MVGRGSFLESLFYANPITGYLVEPFEVPSSRFPLPLSTQVCLSFAVIEL